MRSHTIALVCLLGVVFSLSSSAGAQQTDPAFRFANIFNDNMVLQCDKPVRLWGWARPGSEVALTIDTEKPAAAAPADSPKNTGEYSVTMAYVETNAPPFRTQRVSAKANRSGKWVATLAPMPAGFQPRIIRAQSGGKELALANVLVGEVWVTSGQSNMTWGNYFAKPLIAPGAMYSGIRVFRVNDSWYKPLDDLKARGQWTVCSPQTAGQFPAIPFLYAMYLHRYLKVPVGIVQNARGGTNAISWTSRAHIEAIDDPLLNQDLADYDKETAAWETEAGRAKAMADWRELCGKREADYQRKVADAKAKGKPVPTKPRKPRPPQDPRSGWSPPAGLYNAMVRPLQGLVVRGTLYYQGEGEGNWSERWVQYEDVFPAVIDAFRKTFDDPNLPFGIIGLAGWGSSNPTPEVECAWGRFAVIRDIHRRTHLKTPNTGYISIYDLGNEFIHPNWKQPVGERAARWALAKVYGQSHIPHRGHQYKSMEIRGDRILLTFEQDPSFVKPGQTAKGPNWMELPSTTTGFNDKTMKFNGFVIAGKDRRWYPAKVRQNMDKPALEVWSDLVPRPVAVRYGWACWPQGNACSHQSRLPVPVFRTDDWPVPPNKAQAAKLEEIARRQAEDRELRTLLTQLANSELSKRYAEQNPQYQQALDALQKAAAECGKKDPAE